MAKIQTATCQDCGWQGPVEETKELRNVWDRVQPGDVMPAGECQLLRGRRDHDGVRDRRQGVLRPQGSNRSASSPAVEPRSWAATAR